MKVFTSSIGMDNTSANVLIRPGRQRTRIIMSLMSILPVVCAALLAGFLLASASAVESAVLAPEEVFAQRFLAVLSQQGG